MDVISMFLLTLLDNIKNIPKIRLIIKSFVRIPRTRFIPLTRKSKIHQYSGENIV